MSSLTHGKTECLLRLLTADLLLRNRSFLLTSGLLSSMMLLSGLLFGLDFRTTLISGFITSSIISQDSRRLICQEVVKIP